MRRAEHPSLVDEPDDAVHEEQELVFKELRGPLRGQRTFTGAALLGNGDIVPILDVITLFELASHAPSMEALPSAPRRHPVRAARVLVVDDSLVAGELQKNILQAAGYHSEIAQDGAEAAVRQGREAGPPRRRQAPDREGRRRSPRAGPRRMKF